MKTEKQNPFEVGPLDYGQSLVLDSHAFLFTNIDPATEVLRLTQDGFHYRGKLIEDAGEAHELFLKYMRMNTPT